MPPASALLGWQPEVAAPFGAPCHSSLPVVLAKLITPARLSPMRTPVPEEIVLSGADDELPSVEVSSAPDHAVRPLPVSTAKTRSQAAP